jgi:hypothetical protein
LKRINTGITEKIPAIKFNSMVLTPIEFGDIFNKIYAEARMNKNA